MNRSTKLEAAKRLLNSLHDEQERWQSQLDDIQRGLRYDVVGVACFPATPGCLVSHRVIVVFGYPQELLG